MPKSLITIVVGDVTEDLESAAASLKNLGVQMFAVAVTADTPSSGYRGLTSGRNYLHSIGNLNELGYLSARLAKDTCEGMQLKRSSSQPL